jgi:hypothetical protein
MSRLCSTQDPPTPQLRDLLLVQWFERIGCEADDRGDAETAERSRRTAAELKRRENRRCREWLAWRAEKDRVTATSRVRDAHGRFVAHQNGHQQRPRERRDGSRSSARSGDSGEGGPHPARRCRCEHPLILADAWTGPAWCRCLWCGHDARTVLL